MLGLQRTFLTTKRRCWLANVNISLKIFVNIDGIGENIEDAEFVIIFVRNHSMPWRILRELHRLNMVVWCVTRLGTISIYMDRLVEIQMALRNLACLLLHQGQFAKTKNAVELTELLYDHLWICDADVFNTIGAVYNYWLEVTVYS